MVPIENYKQRMSELTAVFTALPASENSRYNLQTAKAKPKSDQNKSVGVGWGGGDLAQ